MPDFSKKSQGRNSYISARSALPSFPLLNIPVVECISRLMTPKYLRIILLSEFLVAVIAVFTAWSEIGGQATLDVMPWGWKFGLGIGLPVVFVAYSAALLAGDSIWNARSAKWLALIIVLLLGMGVVTYYYVLQVENSESGQEQENSAVSLQSHAVKAMPYDA
jgi:hypothetical protein